MQMFVLTSFNGYFTSGKGCQQSLFWLSIVASLGPTKPAVPVKKMSFWSCLMVGPPLVVNSLLGQDPIYSALW